MRMLMTIRGPQACLTAAPARPPLPRPSAHALLVHTTFWETASHALPGSTRKRVLSLLATLALRESTRRPLEPRHALPALRAPSKLQPAKPRASHAVRGVTRHPRVGPRCALTAALRARFLHPVLRAAASAAAEPTSPRRARAPACRAVRGPTRLKGQFRAPLAPWEPSQRAARNPARTARQDSTRARQGRHLSAPPVLRALTQHWARPPARAARRAPTSPPQASVRAPRATVARTVPRQASRQSRGSAQQTRTLQVGRRPARFAKRGLPRRQVHLPAR